MAEYKNAEGYADPTAFGAFCAIEKEEKALRAFRPIVYICSPFAGDIENNTAAARRYSRFAVEAGYIPIAPHLLFPQFLDDSNPYALQAAISGKQWSGYKLVEGRSNRKYTDENAVIAAVTAAGYDPYEHKILGVTAMTSLLGKKQFNDILGGLITKPQGKPTLVPDSDKRPAMTTIIDDFKEDN